MASLPLAPAPETSERPDGGKGRAVWTPANPAGGDAPDHTASPASSAWQAAAWSGGIRPGPKNVLGTLSVLLMFSIFSKATCVLFR